MQLMMRSVESSSMGTVTNFDWPTRMTDAMMSMACGKVSVNIKGCIERGSHLRAECVAFTLVAGELRVTQNKLGQGRSENRASVEVTAEN